MLDLSAPQAEPVVVYRVGKHSPGLSSYPFLSRWLIRIVYFWTGYQVTPHDIGIASSEEKALEMCLDDSYFYKPLYLDRSLPAEECAPGPVVWPYSEARKWYEKHCPDPIILGKEEVPITDNTVITFASLGYHENGNAANAQAKAATEGR